MKSAMSNIVENVCFPNTIFSPVGTPERITSAASAGASFSCRGARLAVSMPESTSSRASSGTDDVFCTRPDNARRKFPTRFLSRVRGGGCEPRRGVGSPSEGRSPGTTALRKSILVPGNVRPNGPRVHQRHGQRPWVLKVMCNQIRVRNCRMTFLPGVTIGRTLGPLGRTPQDIAE